ncbi:MAG: hypothetical protein HKN04_13295 [Rhodothermaceae bacterium]|nr:hypothetical protein [Rhodothermaceae bacterium]
MLLPVLFAAFPDDADAASESSTPSPAETPPPGVPTLDEDAPAASEPLEPPEDRAPLDDYVPGDHPAYDRIQTRSENATPSDSPTRTLVQRLAMGIGIVGVGLLVTMFVLRPDPTDGGTPDLLALAAAHADIIELDERTDDLDLAQEYIYQEFGWPVRVPVLPDARLAGVGIAELAEGVEVPVLQYQPGEGQLITVYVYDYAFLDDAQSYVSLASPVYARLAEDDPVDVRRVGEAYLVLWRRRAAIYTAVLTDDPGPLVEYLRRR